MENQILTGPETASGQNQNLPNLPAKAGKTKKVIITLLILLAVATIIVAAVFYYSKKQTPTTSKNLQSDIAKPLQPGEVRELSDSQTPQQFPKEFLVEPDAQILKNYDSKNSDGQVLGVREYVSNQTMQKNTETFLSLFENGGWKIIDNIKRPDIIIFTADKDGYRLRVVIKPYVVTNKSQVLISNLVK